MASITINNLPEETKKILCSQAAQSGLTLENYVRNLLNQVTIPNQEKHENIADIAKKYFGPKNGVDLELPERRSKRLPVDFIHDNN